MKKETIKIEHKVLLKIERRARREAEIELEIPRFKNKTHKNKKKDYNRQSFKKELRTFY